jgi:hypothetical protein
MGVERRSDIAGDTALFTGVVLDAEDGDKVLFIV